MTRTEELRNDLDNLYFSRKHYIKTLAELEQLGKTNTAEFKTTEENLRILNSNIRRINTELEKVEEDEYMDYLLKRFIGGDDLSSWND